MKAPLVSIITPTYNRAELLPATVASVLRQTIDDFELLIVDDGSTDATAAIVGGFEDPRIRYISERRCARLTRLRNIGMRCARGAFIAFLDSDDLWREDKLARQLEVLDTRPSVRFVLAGYEIFDATGVLRTKLYDPPSDGAECSFDLLFVPLIQGRITLCSSSVLFRRSLLDDVGLQNEELLTGDYEFFTRLAWSSAAAMIHLPLVRVRRHEGNSSQALDAEGLQEAVFSVRRFHELGHISCEIHDERMLAYLPQLARILMRRGNASGARREMSACLRLRAQPARGWIAYARFLLGWHAR
jgi:glycosyltransferase involved in cell wall biosynthesis